jgi:uncharacterized protein (TIGR02391 family)
MSTTSHLFHQIQKLVQELESTPGLAREPSHRTSTLRSLRSSVRDPDLHKIVSKLYSDGHHARAVEAAFKYLNNLVKERANATSYDGANLMKQVFSVNSPVLRLNSGTTVSERDEQLGYMEIMAGCMTGIRNPRAHEHDWEDPELRALELLCLANHLVEKVKQSVKT